MPTRSETPSAPDRRIARVVVEVEPFHLDRPFDYLVGDHADLRVGQRVQVSFAGRRVRGLVVDVADTSDVPAERLRPLTRVLGPHVWARPDEIEVLRWAATRFGAPVADVVRHALPARTVDVERRAAAAGWFPVATRPDWPVDDTPDVSSWEVYGDAGRGLLDDVGSGRGSVWWRPLAGEQVGDRLVELARRTLAGGRDVLVVVPDRGSSVGRAIVAGLGDLVADLRPGPSPRVHYGQWLRARCGAARVVVGERSAAFAPLDRLGLAIVVDEANPAHKERRSPRHHARDVVLERARRAGAVGLVVGTVPSAIGWDLLRRRRLAPVVAPRRAERDARPRFVLADWDRQPSARLSREAMRALEQAAEAGTHGVVLSVRRGEGRAMVCSRCGHRFACPTCATSLVVRDDRLACEGCGWSTSRRIRCGDCGGDLVPLAAGTERIAHELRRGLDVEVAELEGYDAPAPDPPSVLVMTRGSVMDAPPGPIGAVVLPDLDALLLRPTLDAAEDTLRLAMAVASWASPRSTTFDAPVVVQTQRPEHPVIDALLRWDPGAFWRHEAPLREPLRFPPAAQAIRVEVAGDAALRVQEIRASLADGDDVLGPIPEGSRHRFLVRCDDRTRTLEALVPLRSVWSRDGVEVRIDVDPVGGL
ncbi:MAG: hypothetical protein WD575_02605 [Nitriliruptoraceae bacterium]